MRLLFRLLRLSGLPYLFREIIQRDKISILLFHDINSDTAEKTFLLLKEKYNVISLQDYLNVLYNKGGVLPEKALVITFDDGHIQNFDFLPIVQKLNIPITIFLCSSIINTNRNFWFQHPGISDDVEKLKTIANQQRLEKMESLGFSQKKNFEKPQALQKEQIECMCKYINFQSHTKFHPILPMCPYEVAKDEISNSKTSLEKDFNLAIDSLAYPNGDYSLRDIELAKQAGYKSGLTVDYGYNTLKTDPFKLKRLATNDNDDLNELIVKASGLWGFIKTFNGLIDKSGLHKKPIN